MGIIKKATLATVLGATALAVATPAMARPNDHRSDNTGAIVAGGIIGLALGAIIASNANDRYDDYRYRYADRGWTWRDGYYWDGGGRRYLRDGRPFDNGRYDNGRHGYRGDHRGYPRAGRYGY